ncbi:hypothetical protein QBE53_13040 [Vallitaleaceae bacterium 9-2]
MDLRKEDFYTGAFLSYVLNNGVKPALFEGRNTVGRKVYDFTTNEGDFRVYVKYIGKPTSKSKANNRKIWSFPYTEDQVDELNEILMTERTFVFCCICGEEDLNKSKLLLLDRETVRSCIDLERKDKYKPQSLKLRFIKGHWDFDIYGTARSDKKKGNDNTIKIRANNIDEMFGF